MPDQRILMIINEFPPVGESGVQRPLKFLKYMVSNGWDVSVITPKRLPKTVLDATLVKEIPSHAKIYRTGSWAFRGKSMTSLENFRTGMARGKTGCARIKWIILKFVNDLLFPIDKQLGWVPFAWLKAVALIKKHGLRNIYITAYPFSAFLVGVLLKLSFGNKIFWVADYRDAWQFEPKFREKTLKFRQRFIIHFDNLYLHTADYIVFPTDYIRNKYIGSYHWVAQKSSVITNGYDEADFHGIKPHKFDKLTFLYMGKVYPQERNLISLLKEMKSVVDKDFQYIHIGTIGKEILQDIQEAGYDFYKFKGYKDHHTALSFACGSDINVILIEDDLESEGVYTGKLFELLRAGKPIIAFGPKKCIIKDVLEQLQAGIYAPISSPEGIRTAIQKALLMVEKGFKPNDNIYCYSREHTATLLSQIYMQN